jgi:hypothetical protein
MEAGSRTWASPAKAKEEKEPIELDHIDFFASVSI